MTSTIATKTLPNGRTAATDLAPFAGKVNGTVTGAMLMPDGRWDVFYTSGKGRRLRKLVSA